MPALVPFALASAALLALPGPTVLFVVTTVLARGRAASVAVACGIALGHAGTMAAAFCGLGAVIARSNGALGALKVAGALYLITLGARLMLTRPSAVAAALPRAGGLTGVLGQAAAVQLLNPSSLLFATAFLPQFLEPGHPIAPQFAMLAATFVTIALLNALGWAVLAGRIGAAIRAPRVVAQVRRASGAVMAGLGIVTFLAALS